MELIQLQCNVCGAVFLTVPKDGEIECPKCKATDIMEIEEV